MNTQHSRASHGFNPLVSIVIPVYNGSDYLAEAIDSALKQTYKNIEIIIVNDGSTDNGKTESIAKQYQDRVLYYYKENGGAASALNYGISKMNGVYFSWLSHDDLYKPDKILSQINYLKELDDKTILLYGGYENFDNQRGVFERKDFYSQYTSKQLTTSLFPVLHMALNGCTLLIHKSHFDRVGGFNSELPTTQDYDLLFRMFRGQNIKCLPGCQVLSRCHPKQGSKALLDTHISECNSLWLRVYESLSRDEMLSFSNSVYDFYKSEYEFFDENTGYDAVKYYLRKKAFQQLALMSIPSDDFYKNEYCSMPEVSGLENIQTIIKSKERKRIAFFLGDINALGGLNRIVLCTAACLTRYYDVWMIDTVKYDGTGYTMDNNIHEITTIQSCKEITDILLTLDIDVFIGSYNCNDFTLQLYNILYNTPIKVIAWSHEHYLVPYEKYEFHYILHYRLSTLLRVDTVIWLTTLSAAMYEIYGNNSYIIPNMYSLKSKDRDCIRNASCYNQHFLNAINKKKVIISVSRFDDSRKGIEKLIKTFSLIQKKNKECILLIVGSYDLNMSICEKRDVIHGDKWITVRQIIEDANINENTLFFTGITHDVGKYYSLADLHLLTSHNEGFGLVINEAAQYKIPTIAFTNNGFDDIIIDGKTGYIVEDENEMAEKALYLLDNASTLQEMKNMSYENTSRFAPDKITDIWHSLIDHLIDDTAEQFNDFLATARSKRRKLTCADYQWYLKSIDNYLSVSQKPYVVNSSNDHQWFEECEKMKKTVSWRITKPLRMCTQYYRSIKSKGLVGAHKVKTKNN